MNTKFINREEERKNYNHLLESDYKVNKIIILYANMGVGKSNFTQVVLDSQNKRIPIKVKMDDLPHNDLSYIIEIIKTINKLAKECKYNLTTLESFITMDESKNSKYNYKVFTELVKTCKVLTPLKTIIERNLAIGEYAPDKVLNGDEEALQILVDYIKYNFNDKQIVLNVENVQAIDISSLNILLQDILAYTKNSVYIFEYTTNATNNNVGKEELEKLCNKIQNCNATLEKLEVIKLKEILLPYIKREMVEEFKYLIDNLKISYDGNITKIKNYVALLDKNNTNIDTDINGSTDRKINLLSPNEINLLCIISAYPSKLHPDTLKDYFLSFNHNPFNDLDLLLDKLKNEYIADDNQVIGLIDDTMRKIILTQESYVKYLFTAQNFWIQYYQRLVKNNDFTDITEIEALTNLFYLHIKIDQKNIFNVLKRIKELIIKKHFTDKAIQLMETLSQDMFFYKYTDEELEIIQFTLIDLFYFLGLHDKGYELVNKIKTKSNKKTIYKIAFLNILEKNEEVIEIVKKELKNKNLDISYELSLYLFLFVSYYSEKDEKNREEVKKVLKKKKYHNCYEYGFVLRNLELGESYSQSLMNIDKSIEHFQNLNSKVYEGHTRITKMMQLIRLGQLEGAENELSIISSLLENRSREKHYIYINKSVLKLYKCMLFPKENHDYNEIEHDLNLSLNITEKMFYKITIFNNLLIMYILKNDNYNIEQCINKLDFLLSKQENKSLIKVVSSNIAKYYSVTNNGLKDIYLKRAKATFKNFNSYWRYRLYNEEVEVNKLEEEKYRFFRKFDYDLILTSYWHFDVSKIQ